MSVNLSLPIFYRDEPTNLNILFNDKDATLSRPQG